MKCPVIKSAWLIFVLPLLCQWLNAAQLGVLTYEVTTDGIVITDCNEAATEVEIPQTIGMFEVTSIGACFLEAPQSYFNYHTRQPESC